MKGDHQVVAVVIIFFLGATFGGLVEGKLATAIFDDYVPALATLLAAFIGASYAFRLQSEKEERDTQKRKILAGNLAVFNFIRMINTLLNFQVQIIDPIRGKNTAFIEMQPTLHLLELDVDLVLEELAFLLETDNPNLLGELSIERSKFQKALDAINHRSKLHLEQVQPILENAGIEEGEDYTFQKIEQALGNRLYATMHQATDQVISHVDSSISSLQETGNELATMLKKLFPKEKVVSLADPENGEKNYT